MIRVGRFTYKNGEKEYPSYEGFTPIIVLTKTSEYGSLGPYILKDEKGRIFECIYQFSKVYKQVPYSRQEYTKIDRRIVWEHPAEVHAIEDKDGSYNLTDEWLNWRNKGMIWALPVRYPVGNNRYKKDVLFSLAED